MAEYHPRKLPTAGNLPVFTSAKESPDVSAEVIRRGKEFLQSTEAKPQLKGMKGPQ